MKRTIHKISLALVALFLTQAVVGQNIYHTAKLPKNIDESSGAESVSPGTFWTLNDSGGKAEIYQLDTLGNLIRTLKITNANNRDWEDITSDSLGNIYIGNIGNNSNKNTDLSIFKIPNPDYFKADEIEAEIIRFHYEDQKAFPPKKSGWYFDCESLMWFNGYLYMATKNWAEPFDGLSNLYRIPDKAGNYAAQKLSSFNTGGDDRYTHWFTAGDISPDGKTLALLSSDRIWIFYDFQDDDFFGGKHRKIQLPHLTQKEGICFLDDQNILITDEAWKKDLGRNLYLVPLND